MDVHLLRIIMISSILVFSIASFIYGIVALYKKGKIRIRGILLIMGSLIVLFFVIAGLLDWSSTKFKLFGKELRDEKKGFYIKFPGQYRKETDKITAIDGSYVTAQKYTHTFDNIENYLIFADYPDSLLSRYGAKKIEEFSIREIGINEKNSSTLNFSYKGNVSGIEFSKTGSPEIIGYCFMKEDRIFIFYTVLYGMSDSSFDFSIRLYLQNQGSAMYSQTDREVSIDFLRSFRINGGPNWEFPGGEDKETDMNK